MKNITDQLQEKSRVYNKAKKSPSINGTLLQKSPIQNYIFFIQIY